MQNQIVIVGGGAGGLELAALLGRRLGPHEGPRKVLLIDRAVFHLWKPSLHEVAAGSLDSSQEGLDYLMLARRNHFRFMLGEVEGLDPVARRLRLAETRDVDGALLIGARSLDFERLVLATGAGSHLFDTPGAAEHACLLEDVGDAEAFHRGSPRSSCHPPMTVAVCSGSPSSGPARRGSNSPRSFWKDMGSCRRRSTPPSVSRWR